ncbi:MAG: gamma-glutamylcyclotransferase, partial [Phyllobacterium sp.]
MPGYPVRATEEWPARAIRETVSREFKYKPANSMPRWITVETTSGPTPALGFVMNRASPLYAGNLSLVVVADVLAQAWGHVGSGAEYLLNTVTHLEAKGIQDRNLWRLQA